MTYLLQDVKQQTNQSISFDKINCKMNQDLVKNIIPPSSSESVSESSLSPCTKCLSSGEEQFHTSKAVSAPPVDINFLSLDVHLTLVTCALCPTYFLCLANFP